MFVRIVNLFVLTFCVKLCIIQGKNASVNELDYWQLRRFLNEQISLLKNNKNEGQAPLRKLLRKFDQSTEENPDFQEVSEFVLGNMKCSRYSVEKKNPKISKEGNNHFMDLVWTFANEENATVSVSIPISNRSTFLSKTTIPVEKRGEIYFVVNCNIPRNKENLTKEMRFISDTNTNFKSFTNASGHFHKSHEILAEKRNLTETTETEFYVKNSIDNLNIIVLGNISKVNLRIPVDQETLLKWNESGKISDLMRSLKRMTGTMGVRLNVRYPPSGEWCLKLIPREGSNYRFIIATVFNDSITEDMNIFRRDENATDDFKEERQEEIVAESRYNAKIVENPTTYNVAGHQMNTDNTSSNKFSSKLVQHDSHDDEPRHWKTPDEENEKWINNSNILKLPKILYVSSKDESLKDLTQSTNLDSRIGIPEIQFSDEESNNDNFMKILVGPQIEERVNHESLELEDLTRDASDNFFQKKVVFVDVSSDSNLIIKAGAGRVRIIFDIKNNQITDSIICYRASASPLRAIELYPSNPLINRYCHAASPGQIVTVAVEIFVPNGIPDTVNSVTLTVLVQGLQSKTIQKTANFYVQNSNPRKVDDTRPTIKYFFNNNCGGHLREDKCSKSIWSVDITVHDVDSGLKLVTSSPSGLEARTDYVSGTTNQVTFFYYATCCHTTVDISAVDMYENYNNRRIDVTEWDNLSDGEIAAIVMGVLFLILLIILIILLIVYCVKKTKSRDLPYTQRYGSAGPPTQRPGRTSF